MKKVDGRDVCELGIDEIGDRGQADRNTEMSRAFFALRVHRKPNETGQEGSRNIGSVAGQEH